MEFRLEDNEHKALIEILMGKTMSKACEDNKCIYGRISKYKNMLFPEYKCKRSFDFPLEDAERRLSFAVGSRVVKSEPKVTPPLIEDLFKDEPKEKPGSRMIDVGPLERMNRKLFEQVIKVAHAAMTMENVGSLFKGIIC